MTQTEAQRLYGAPNCSGAQRHNFLQFLQSFQRNGYPKRVSNIAIFAAQERARARGGASKVPTVRRECSPRSIKKLYGKSANGCFHRAMQSNAGGVIGGRLALLKFVGVRGECDTENYIARFFPPSVTLDPHVITNPPENSFLPPTTTKESAGESARARGSLKSPNRSPRMLPAIH